MSQNNKSFNPFEPWAQDWSKNATSNMENMKDHVNKNVKNLSSMAQMFTESMQAMTRRATDMARKNAENSAQDMKAAMSSQSFEELQKNLANSFANNNKECWANAKEMTEMSSDHAKRFIDACDNLSQECVKTWNDVAPKKADKK